MIQNPYPGPDHHRKLISSSKVSMKLANYICSSRAHRQHDRPTDLIAFIGGNNNNNTNTTTTAGSTEMMCKQDRDPDSDDVWMLRLEQCVDFTQRRDWKSFSFLLHLQPLQCHNLLYASRTHYMSEMCCLLYRVQ